jgi:hypothetical protein
MEKQNLQIKEIRELSKRFSPSELESCVNQQLKDGENICDVKGQTEEVVSVLSKAQFVKDMIGKGVSMNDAVRELARRIRHVQQGRNAS